jgi:hypothetical protein
MVSTESQQTAEPVDIELVLDALGEERSLDEMFTDAVKLWDAERSDRARLLVRVLHYLKNLAERPMTGAVPRAPRAKKIERSPEEGTLHPKAIEAGLSPDMKLLGKYPVACPARRRDCNGRPELPRSICEIFNSCWTNPFSKIFMLAQAETKAQRS